MSDIDYSIHYRRFHDDTEVHAETMARWLASMLQPYLPEDRATTTVDIGCGYGFALRALRNQGFTNLQGVEVSPQQASRCNSAGFIVAVTANSQSWLEERRGAFGMILLLDVLEHLPPTDQIPLLRAIYNSLLPGGRLILTVPNANAILSSRWRYIDFTHFSSFTEHSLYFVLRNAGFTSIHMDASKGLGPAPWRLWRPHDRASLRKWLVRWAWLQVFKAEIPWEKLDDIPFDLNLLAVATKTD